MLKSDYQLILLLWGFPCVQGYVIYRTVLQYYSAGDEDGEDAYDMRKALSRDKAKKSMVPLTKPIHPWDLEQAA